MKILTEYAIDSQFIDILKAYPHNMFYNIRNRTWVMITHIIKAKDHIYQSYIVEYIFLSETNLCAHYISKQRSYFG